MINGIKMKLEEEYNKDMMTILINGIELMNMKF